MIEGVLVIQIKIYFNDKCICRNQAIFDVDDYNSVF